jgi:hypothetical protein
MPGIWDFFGDNSSAYNDYANKLRERGDTYNPYIERGQDAGRRFGDISNLLTDDPNWLQDEIAAGYEMSPYQKYLLDQTTQRSNYNAANSGMIQSPLAQKALNEDINLQTGQFLNDYIQHSLGTFGQGYAGLGALNEQGYNALGAKNDFYHNAAGANFQGDVSHQDAINSGIGQFADWGENFIPGGSYKKYFQGLVGDKNTGGIGGRDLNNRPGGGSNLDFWER